MKRRSLVAAAFGACLALGLGLGVGLWHRDGATPAEMRVRIAELRRERAELRRRVDRLLAKDVRLEGMPHDDVVVGVPTDLARSLIAHVLRGFGDSVVVRLTGLKVHTDGTIKKVITLGEYRLDVTIDEVTGRLRTGEPAIRFGGNTVAVSLPIVLESGSGDATIDFAWDGKNVSGAICGDMEIRRKVSGSVRPARYPLRGSVLLSSTTQQIVATPRFPVLRVNLKVVPSQASWNAVQRILDEKEGVCGFVLDKVDIKGAIEGLVAKGFDVTLPTDRLKALALPVGIASTMKLRDETVTLGLAVGELAITQHMLWLGANVSVDAASPSGGTDPARPPVARGRRARGAAQVDGRLPVHPRAGASP